MKKNTATKWIVFAFDRTDNTPKTGDAAQITADVYIDGGSANAVDDTNPAELGAGYYIFDITSAECNGDLVVISPVSSTADIQVIGVPGAAWTSTTSADLAAIDALIDTVDGNVDSILADTGELQTDWANGGRLDLLLDGATAPSAATIADAVWDEAAAGHVAAGSMGASVGDISGPLATIDAKMDVVGAGFDDLAAAIATVDSNVDAILVDTGTTLDAAVAAVKGDTAAILTDTGTTVPAQITALEGKVDIIDTNVDAINLTAADIADAVWDEATAGHSTAGSAGKAIVDSASAGDPWSTPLPGSYAPGTAGKKISDMAVEVSAVLIDTGTTLDNKINNIGTVVDVLTANLATVDSNVDAILVDTGTTLDGKINTIDSVVDAITVTTPPTAAAIADAVLDELVAGHTVAGSLSAVVSAISGGITSSPAGLGAVRNTITVTVDGNPESGVDVWITSDEAGTVVVAGTLVTNTAGQVSFWLDAGTYFVWQQKPGFNFTIPDTLVVT